MGVVLKNVWGMELNQISEGGVNSVLEMHVKINQLDEVMVWTCTLYVC